MVSKWRAQVIHIYEQSVGSILTACSIEVVQWTNEGYKKSAQVSELQYENAKE